MVARKGKKRERKEKGEKKREAKVRLENQAIAIREEKFKRVLFERRMPDAFIIQAHRKGMVSNVKIVNDFPTFRSVTFRRGCFERSSRARIAGRTSFIQKMADASRTYVKPKLANRES